MSDLNAQPPRRRNPFITVLLVVVGIILLLPGLCSLFVIGLGGVGGGAAGIVLVTFLIAVGGIALIVHAFRRPQS